MPSFAPSCAHDHDCADENCGAAFSLHKHIDMPRVRCLNEATEGSVRGIFRRWEERLDFSGSPLASNEGDDELLIHVPFDGSVKLKAICLIGAPDGYSPGELRVFTNRDDVDFATVADLPPTQSWELAENLDGRIELPTQVTRFNGVHSLDLHIPRSLGASETKIHFIGLKGDFTERKREAVIAVYEARAVPSDHQKVPGTDQQGWNPTA